MHLKPAIQAMDKGGKLDVRVGVRDRNVEVAAFMESQGKGFMKELSSH